MGTFAAVLTRRIRGWRWKNLVTSSAGAGQCCFTEQLSGMRPSQLLLGA